MHLRNQRFKKFIPWICSLTNYKTINPNNLYRKLKDRLFSSGRESERPAGATRGYVFGGERQEADRQLADQLRWGGGRRHHQQDGERNDRGTERNESLERKLYSRSQVSINSIFRLSYYYLVFNRNIYFHKMPNQRNRLRWDKITSAWKQ